MDSYKGKMMKKMKTKREQFVDMIENIGEWLIDRFEASLSSDQKMPLHLYLLHSLWFIPRNFIGKWHWRIFVHGKCAIKGCDEHYSCGGDLPDDVSWYCKRCGAEGINKVVYTHVLFYLDSPLRNFWEALRGR